MTPSSLHTLADWRAAYAGGARPAELLAPLLARLAAQADDPAWIHRCDAGFVAQQCERLAGADRSRSGLASVVARGFSATDTFHARYALEALRRRLAPLWRLVDVLMVPTTPTCPTRAAVAAEPVLRNSELGRYTNFVNLLGQAALALPSGISRSGLPFGVTVITPSGSDAALVDLGLRWEAARALLLGCRLRAAQPADTALQAGPAAAPTLAVAVVGPTWPACRCMASSASAAAG